jgi:topoisomerase-4 subunit A
MTDINQPTLFDNNNDDTLTLGLYAEQAYLDYAVSVVKGRALPELGDGQKPVQRRILFAMQAMGLQTGSRPVKSARVVGDVLGKFHPHGDQAAYDALVRMAQAFTLRYPLIDGQGNFGSRDGDNAAAMRYTEARLTPIAKLLLDELGEGTVNFVQNYDGSQLEPASLPARLPMLLLNGASGIAVGMATEMPSHNLTEVAAACVALIKNPKLDHAAIQAMVPGPDFPGGAQIISEPQDIAQVYSLGRGSLKARARWHFEELARGQWQLVVTELPPSTSGQKVLEEIEDMTNPKIKTGKKSLTPEQQQTKAQVLALLDTVRDESGKDADVRLVFEPKTSRVERDQFVTVLLAQTSLETNVSINLVCVGTDGRPKQKGLHDILVEWIEFRAKTILRRSEYRLEKVLDRIHVLEGRMVVYLNVDEVIQTIRESDEPKAALMDRFKLTERQAEDILEMRLRQLARLEGIRIEQELKDKSGEQAKLEELIQKPTALRKLMIKEIEADAKAFGDPRRTLIEPAERAVLSVKVTDEPVTVIVSQKGWVRSRQGHGHDESQFNFKTGDGFYGAFECRSTDDLVVLGSNGRTYSVSVADLPSARGDGSPVTAFVDLEPGTQVAHFVASDAKQMWLIVTTGGFGFKAPASAMVTRQKAGKQFVNIEAQEQLLRPVRLDPAHQHIALFSSRQRISLIESDEIKKLTGGGKGTMLMALDASDQLQQVSEVGAKGLTIRGTYRSQERTDVLTGSALAVYFSKRARKGKLLQTRIKNPELG